MHYFIIVVITMIVTISANKVCIWCFELGVCVWCVVSQRWRHSHVQFNAHHISSQCLVMHNLTEYVDTVILWAEHVALLSLLSLLLLLQWTLIRFVVAEMMNSKISFRDICVLLYDKMKCCVTVNKHAEFGCDPKAITTTNIIYKHRHCTNNNNNNDNHMISASNDNDFLIFWFYVIEKPTRFPTHNKNWKINEWESQL